MTTKNTTKNLDYIQQFDELREMDPRATKSDFYHTFVFDDLYSRSMLIQIMNGTRAPESDNVYTLFDNAMKIYSNNVIDNRRYFKHENGEDSIIMSTYHSICRTYPEFINADRFGSVTNYPGVNYKQALTSKIPTAGGVDAYEAMTLGLLVGFARNRNDHFSNMRDYRRMKHLIMRAQLGNGLKIKTLSEIAEESDIDLEDLKHPERLCKDIIRYMETQEKLVKKLPRYQIRTNGRNKRWIRNTID
ncbi:hypothetical protein LMB49_03870 [Limosilactobacillus reuteri]|uniref:hypothetical protein n=1 Tax=Limosilactobacillus reuteri TaxID=1598 RepID=UPI001E4530FD|nr:hypothetical protein [Limosilactobacillus reuteri]MCC4370535.1 hypothetical protein [Limosilactobacillus reuteri]MCC4509410.1 hypothetical protein [Limosilactobacillus reuteri]